MLDRDGYRPNVAIVLVNSRTLSLGQADTRNTRGSFRKAVSIPAGRPRRRCPGVRKNRSGAGDVGFSAHPRVLRYEVPGMDQARMAGQLRGQTQICTSALVGRGQAVPARDRPFPSSTLALAQLLDPARAVIDSNGRVSPGLDRARALPAPSTAHPARAPVRLGARGRSFAVQQPSQRRLAPDARRLVMRRLNEAAGAGLAFRRQRNIPIVLMPIMPPPMIIETMKPASTTPSRMPQITTTMV